jgi:thioredoxin 1
MAAMANDGLTVTCICAEWCGTCRDYRKGFYALAERFPGARFEWLDTEYDAEKVGDREVENFPTLLIQHGADELFYGTLLPHHEHLARLLEKLTEEKS